MNRCFTRLLSILLLSCAVCGAASADIVDGYIREYQEKSHVPGVSVAVIRDGKVVKEQSYGLANVELSVPASNSTVYELASVTKQFTATAVMMLIKDGKLHLDDKIANLLPGLPSAWSGVTVRHLLNHTSGIKSYTNIEGFGLQLRKDYTHDEIIAFSAKEPMEFAPGEKWSYNNSGYFLLGMAIEKVTGKSYGDFLSERIFKPLGMSRTRVNDLSAIIQGRAQGYGWNGASLRNGEYVSPTQPFAAGALVTTIDDMVKWDGALTSARLLSKPTLEQMWTPTRLSDGKMAEYGFGWNVHTVNGHRLISHSGGIPGFSTEIARYVDDHLTVIVLMNSDAGNAITLAQTIAGRYVPQIISKAPTTFKVDPAVLARYTGYYDLGGQTHAVTLQDRRLSLTSPIPGDKNWSLAPISKDTFYLDNQNVDPEWKYRFTFKLDAAGLPAHIAATADGASAGDAQWIGPLAHTLTAQPDPDPELTKGIEATARVLAKGVTPSDTLSNLSAGLRKNVGAAPVAELAGIQSIAFIAARDIAGQGIAKHGEKVSRVAYYRLEAGSASKYLLVFLTGDHLIAGEDLGAE